MLSKNHLHDRAGNLRILSSLICSFAQIAQIKWATVSDSLRSTRTNERLWANCSGRSCQKSDRELITQVAHDKSANERFAQKNLTKMIKSYFLVCFLYVKKTECIAHSLFFNERCERMAQVAHQKWVMWANRSGRSPKMSNLERFAQVAQRKWAIVRKSLRLLTKN